jgi:hypothetical protein
MNLGDIKSIGFHIADGEFTAAKLFINGEEYPIDPISDRLVVARDEDGMLAVEWQRGEPVAYSSAIGDSADWDFDKYGVEFFIWRWRKAACC